MKSLLILICFLFSLEILAKNKCQFFMKVSSTIIGKTRDKDITSFNTVPYPDNIHDSGAPPRLPLIKTDKNICKSDCFVTVTLKTKKKSWKQKIHL